MKNMGQQVKSSCHVLSAEDNLKRGNIFPSTSLSSLFSFPLTVSYMGEITQSFDLIWGVIVISWSISVTQQVLSWG